MGKNMTLDTGNDSCLICQSLDYDVVFSYDQPDQYEVAVGISQEGYFRKWVQCKNCGLYYSIYSRSKEALDRIYTTDYRGEHSIWRKDSIETTFQRVIALPASESETKYRVQWIKEHIWNARKSGLVKQTAPPYRMLDVGGGTGVFAYEFQDDEWIPHVIDPDENAEFIKAKLNIPFLQKMHEPNSFGFTFDLIATVFVLEHLLHPIDFLNALHQDMGPDSFLYIEVPDALCFKFKPPEDDIYNSCHLWMFAPQTLISLLESCGFDVSNVHRTKTIRGHYSLMVLAGEKWK